MSLLHILLTACLVFLVVVTAQPMLGRLAASQGWVDKPGARKRHHHATPLAGGMAIVCGLLASIFAYRWPQAALGLLLALAVIFSIGFFDDLRPLRARHRLMAQLFAVLLTVIVGGTMIKSLDGTFVPWALPLGAVALPFTLVAMTGVINAFNMSDGVDGLCGGYSAAALFWLTIVGIIIEHQSPGAGALREITGVAAPALAAVLGFLVYNMRYPGRRRAAVFLGDGGSMVLGLLVGWLSVRAAGSYGDASLNPVAALCLILLPLSDMFSSVVRRYRNGQTPLTADRRHIHHLLIARGMSARRAVFVLNALALVAGGLGVMIWQIGDISHIVFWVLVLAFALYCRFAHAYWRNYRRRKMEPADSIVYDTPSAQRT